MKDRKHKRQKRRNSQGSHDIQPQLFSITVTDSDIEVSHRYTRDGMLDLLISSRKKQGRFSKDAFRIRRPGKDRKKTLQYRLQMRTRETERVVEYVSKPACSRYSESRVRGNDTEFSREEIIIIHQKMLTAFQEAFQQNWATNNARLIELVVWMTASRPNDPFSYETCCYVSNVDPDIVRDAILKQVRARYKHERLHYDVFRQSVLAAERGDADALMWLYSTDESEFSFLGLCKMFDFEPKAGRSTIRVPSGIASQVA
ncbi:hypothetical protein [Xanthomonas hortorum]|uniref:hypothetical protein n=1 Tax=Xanthomonas hortorum TaxID=56454 RepID=UPI003982F6C1